MDNTSRYLIWYHWSKIGMRHLLSAKRNAWRGRDPLENKCVGQLKILIFLLFYSFTYYHTWGVWQMEKIGWFLLANSEGKRVGWYRVMMDCFLYFGLSVKQGCGAPIDYWLRYIWMLTSGGYMFDQRILFYATEDVPIYVVNDVNRAASLKASLLVCWDIYGRRVKGSWSCADHIWVASILWDLVGVGTYKMLIWGASCHVITCVNKDHYCRGYHQRLGAGSDWAMGYHLPVDLMGTTQYCNWTWGCWLVELYNNHAGFKLEDVSYKNKTVSSSLRM
ncbi:hypothetical protein R6Q59_035795 [Mikania micrantha]